MPRGVILISAGHGGGDPGTPGADHTEAALALELRDLVASRVQRLGHTVVRDGEPGQNLGLRQAIARARSAAVAVELHFNASTPGATGVECLGTEETRALCVHLTRAVAAVLGTPIRGSRGGYLHHTDSARGTLGFCRAGGVILEVCFMNDGDLGRYLPRKLRVAEAIANVVHLASSRCLAVPPGESTLAAPLRPRRGIAPGTASTGARSRSAPQRRARG